MAKNKLVQGAVTRFTRSVPREVFTMQKRSQGEIFGIALMFVVIILGIIVYSQVSKFSPDRDEEDANALKYELLAKTTLDTLMEMSTGCYVERNKDSLSDLINYCISNSYQDIDPEIECENNEIKYACEHSVEIINRTLVNLFKDRQDTLATIGNINYTFAIDLEYDAAQLSDLILTEGGQKTEDENNERLNELRRDRFQKATSGLYVWESAYRGVSVELNLYYR